MVTMNIHLPQFISESCLYLSCGNELNVPSKLICSQSSFPQYITLMETVSCFLLISVSSYFYFSGAGLFSFSLYTALLILEQEIFFLLLLLFNICADLLVVFYLFNSPSFLPYLACSVLRLWNISWCLCLCSFNIARMFLRQVKTILGCSITEKCCRAEWPKSIL